MMAALTLAGAAETAGVTQPPQPDRADDAAAEAKATTSPPDEGRYVYDPGGGLSSRAGGSAIATQKTFSATIGGQIYSTIGTPIGSVIGQPR